MPTKQTKPERLATSAKIEVPLVFACSEGSHGSRSWEAGLCIALSILRRSPGDLGYAAARMRLGVFPATLVLLLSSQAWADGAGSGTPSTDRTVTDSSSAPEQAHDHFEQALTLYRAGKYQHAAEELQAALASDPSGKDLVYNLALVQDPRLRGVVLPLGDGVGFAVRVG